MLSFLLENTPYFAGRDSSHSKRIQLPCLIAPVVIVAFRFDSALVVSLAHSKLDCTLYVIDTL